MPRRILWVLAATLALYVGALIAVLIVGSNDFKVAMIAVGGTAIGAIAGTVGSVSGARAQASAAHDAAQLQAISDMGIKRAELEAARESLVQEQRYQLAGVAYQELNSLLNLSRKLGTSIKSYASYDDVVIDLQVINTHANLLAANPIIGTDEELVTDIRSYVTAIGLAAWEDWQVKQNPDYRRDRPEEWVPPGLLGDQLAQRVGRWIQAATTAAGLQPNDARN